jgi:hypothetical protein
MTEAPNQGDAASRWPISDDIYNLYLFAVAGVVG